MPNSTAIIILAAGSSSRMGKPKQLLEYNGSTLIHHIINTALAVKRIASAPKAETISAEIFIVLGAYADDIRYEITSTFNRKERKEFTILVNPEWHEGISSSIRCGIAALPKESDAALFLLCDQPRITAEHLKNIIHSSIVYPNAQIIASEYSNTLGVPALFRKMLFPELLKLIGDEGARGVIRSHHKDTIAIPFPDAAFDLDEPEQL